MATNHPPLCNRFRSDDYTFQFSTPVFSNLPQPSLTPTTGGLPPQTIVNSPNAIFSTGANATFGATSPNTTCNPPSNLPPRNSTTARTASGNIPESSTIPEAVPDDVTVAELRAELTVNGVPIAPGTISLEQRKQLLTIAKSTDIDNQLFMLLPDTVRVAPTSISGSTYNHGEVMVLLKLAKRLLPTSTGEWDTLAEHHNRFMAVDGRASRTGSSLKKKMKDLIRKPTGAGEEFSDFQRPIVEIFNLINDKVGAANYDSSASYRLNLQLGIDSPKSTITSTNAAKNMLNGFTKSPKDSTKKRRPNVQSPPTKKQKKDNSSNYSHVFDMIAKKIEFDMNKDKIEQEDITKKVECMEKKIGGVEQKLDILIQLVTDKREKSLDSFAKEIGCEEISSD